MNAFGILWSLCGIQMHFSSVANRFRCRFVRSSCGAPFYSSSSCCCCCSRPSLALALALWDPTPALALALASSPVQSVCVCVCVCVAQLIAMARTTIFWGHFVAASRKCNPKFRIGILHPHPHPLAFIYLIIWPKCNMCMRRRARLVIRMPDTQCTTIFKRNYLRKDY